MNSSRNTNPALVKRWETRGNAVYKPDLGVVKSLAMLPKNSNDASAFISVLKDLKNVNAMLQVAQKFPDDPQVLANLAINLMETNPESSYKAAERAHDLDPENPVLSALASKCSETCADLPRAIDFMDISLKSWSEEPEWQIRAARMNEAAGDYQKAIGHWEQVIVLQSGNLEPLVALGKDYLAIDETEKAIETLESARKIDPNSVETYMSLPGHMSAQATFPPHWITQLCRTIGRQEFGAIDLMRRNCHEYGRSAAGTGIRQLRTGQEARKCKSDFVRLAGCKSQERDHGKPGCYRTRHCEWQ